MFNLFTLACPTCASNYEVGGGDASGWAIIIMLTVLVPVLFTIGFCMVRIAKREQQNLDPSLQDPLQES